MRKRLAATIVAVGLVMLVAGVVAGGAGATEPRCCKKTGGGGLPLTGLPLYLPVLASIGLLGTGIVLRRRTRDELYVSRR